jgi:hypothetical protein
MLQHRARCHGRSKLTGAWSIHALMIGASTCCLASTFSGDWRSKSVETRQLPVLHAAVHSQTQGIVLFTRLSSPKKDCAHIHAHHFMSYGPSWAFDLHRDAIGLITPTLRLLYVEMQVCSRQLRTKPLLLSHWTCFKYLKRVISVGQDIVLDPETAISTTFNQYPVAPSAVRTQGTG